MWDIIFCVFLMITYILVKMREDIKKDERAIRDRKQHTLDGIRMGVVAVKQLKEHPNGVPIRLQMSRDEFLTLIIKPNGDVISEDDT